MNETLTPKQDSFCVHYTTIGAKTFSNGTKAAQAAGYSEKGAYARASELLRLRKVLERISELHKENMQRNMITVSEVTRWFRRLRSKAATEKDYGSACRANENLGKRIGYYEADNIQKAPVIDQAEEDKRRRIIDAQFEAIDADKILGLPEPLVLAEQDVARKDEQGTDATRLGIGASRSTTDKVSVDGQG